MNDLKNRIEFLKRVIKLFKLLNFFGVFNWVLNPALHQLDKLECDLYFRYGMHLLDKNYYR